MLALCVVSHWLLDYIAHRPDMPITPHGARVGLGLWNSMPATLIAEFTLFAAGTALYAGTTRAKDRRGTYVLWSLLIFLVICYMGALFGPPPPSVHALAGSALGIWLTVPWAAWADRHRVLRNS